MKRALPQTRPLLALLPNPAAPTSLSPTSTLGGGVLGGWMEARTPPHKTQTSAPVEREQEGPPRTPEQDPGRAWGWGGEGRSAHATLLLLSMGTGHRGPGHTPGAHFAAQAQSRPGAACLHPHRTGGGLKSQGPFKGRERKFTPDRPHSEAPGGDSTTLHLVHEQSKNQGEREGGTK